MCGDFRICATKMEEVSQKYIYSDFYLSTNNLYINECKNSLVTKTSFLIAGTFLLIYFIAMFGCGIPIFFQEVATGQYLGSGGLTMIGQLVPILQGT